MKHKIVLGGEISGIKFYECAYCLKQISDKEYSYVQSEDCFGGQHFGVKFGNSYRCEFCSMNMSREGNGGGGCFGVLPKKK